MKIRILSLIILYPMFFKSFSQESSQLSKVLNNWIEKPTSELSAQLNKLPNKEVISVNEAKLICTSLEVVIDKLKNSFTEKIEDNLYGITVLFQEASVKESANYLNENGIKLLSKILNIIHSKSYETKSYGGTEMMILKMFAIYGNHEGLAKLAELINNDFKNEEYLWSVILHYIAEDAEKYKFIAEKLNGKIPLGFLGISYLDMCNSMAIKDDSFKYPFDNQAGYNYLMNILSTASEENESYVVSVTASIPFLRSSFQDSLLKTVSSYKSIDVQIEAAWAGTKLKKENYLNKLIEYARDYRYSSKAVQYLEELNLNNSIPNEVRDPDFKALSEMCSWLSHPNEFGSYPDSAEIYDKRELFWPPTKDKRTLYLIKYKYKNHKEDGSDEIGIGLVGSVTFSLFSLEKINEMEPNQIYAIHCNWELEKKNYEDIKSGINLLRKYNKGFQ